MTSPKKVLKAIGPKLVPFFKTVAIYFVVFLPSSQPSLLAAILKCLPILSLVGFVLLHGISLGEEYAYSRRILSGLILSLIADALLVWKETFLPGLGLFLLVQICYISAFGFRPLNLFLMLFIYGSLGIGMSFILPQLSGFMYLSVSVYSFILTTMMWRAVARVQFFDDLWTWTKLCSCVGGILFVISDTILGVNEFVFDIPYAQALIMTTYYGAQLGISLSVVDSKASFLDELKAQNSNEKAKLLLKQVDEDSQESSLLYRYKSKQYPMPKVESSRFPIILEDKFYDLHQKED